MATTPTPTLTSPPPRLEFLSTNGLSYHASYNPSKYLRTATLRGPNFAALQENYATYDKYDSHKLIRKYYSKKLANITCIHKDFTQYSRYRCKTLKGLTLIGPCRVKVPPFPLKSLTISDAQASTKFKGITANKLTTACKHLETLVFNKGLSHPFFKGIRKMVNLRVLTITLTEAQLLHPKQVFSNLKHLQKVNLAVKGSAAVVFRTPEKIDKLLLFFKNLLALKGLRTIKLNFQEASLCRDEEFIETLLTYLNQPRLLSFNVQVELESCGHFNMKKIGPLLSRVNFLAIRGSDRENIVDHINGFAGNSIVPRPNYLREVSHTVSRSQRVLDILFSDVHKSEMLHILSSFEQYNCLESLYVNLKEAGTDTNILQKFSWVQNLKNITLDIENIPDRNVRNAIIGFACLLKSAKNLESLTLCDSNSLIYSFNAKNDAIELLLRQLPSMEALKSLRIEQLSPNVVSWETARKMLLSVKNLRQFHFCVRINSKVKPVPIDLFFPFDEMCQLTDLKMEILTPITFESIEHFVYNISKLENLEVLDLMRGSMHGITFNLVCSLMKNLSLLKNLRKVEICTGMNFDQVNQFIEVFYGAAEEMLMRKLREECRNLFHSNLKLEKVHLYQHNWFEIKYVR